MNKKTMRNHLAAIVLAALAPVMAACSDQGDVPATPAGPPPRHIEDGFGVASPPFADPPKPARNTIVDAAVRAFGDTPGWTIGSGGGNGSGIPVNDHLSMSRGPASTEGCTGGFLAQDASGKKFIITAGHCAKGDGDAPAEMFRSDGTTVKPAGFVAEGTAFDAAWFPDDGKYNPNLRGGVDATDILNSPGEITPDGAIAPEVGMRVCATGKTSAWRCGVIIDVHGDSFTTNFESRPGDSGGAIIAGNKLVGITTHWWRTEGRETTTATRADRILERSGLTLAGPRY